ncbi:MAG: transketolase C-terminal domain-containing protein [Saprospiraceae bacterium]
MTIVSFNKMMEVVKIAAVELEKQGISAEVIDLRTMRPLDYNTVIESVKDEQVWWSLMKAGLLQVYRIEIAYMVQKRAFGFLMHR